MRCARAVVVAGVIAALGGMGGCGSSSNAPPAALNHADASPDADASPEAVSPDAARDSSDPSDGALDAEPRSISIDKFPKAFAQLYCRRVYDCCLPADRPRAAPGADERMCVADMTDNARSNGVLLLGFDGVRYFPVVGARCLAVLERGACGDIFEPQAATLIACQDVFSGTLPIGASCEDGRQCASETCANGACAVSVTCPADQVFDGESNSCLPRVGLGATCYVPRQCAVDAACVGGVCRQRRADGQPCQIVEDCLGSCGLPTSGPAVCGPGLCTGQ